MWQWHTKEQFCCFSEHESGPVICYSVSLLLRRETSPLKVTAVVHIYSSSTDLCVRGGKKTAFQKDIWRLKCVGSFNKYLNQLSYLGRIQEEGTHI